MIKLFESFNEIENICQKYGIENYTINSDGSIDVYDDVYLVLECLKKLPLNFNQVTGNFNCRNNKLTSLEDAPRRVGGNFYCYDNKLTSLENCPQKVGEDFDCHNNKIASFEHLPFSIGGHFLCVGNPIYNIWKLFNDFSKIELFNYYDIIREVDGKPWIKEIVLDRLNDFLEEIGKEPVKKVKGYINI